MSKIEKVFMHIYCVLALVAFALLIYVVYSDYTETHVQTEEEYVNIDSLYTVKHAYSEGHDYKLLIDKKNNKVKSIEHSMECPKCFAAFE